MGWSTVTLVNEVSWFNTFTATVFAGIPRIGRPWVLTTEPSGSLKCRYTTFPMIFVKGVLIGGAADLDRLIDSGELARMLAP